MNYSVESDISSARLCELVSIGVLPNTGKKGIGKKLMEAVREFATEEGAYEILLTTDSQNNEVVNRFYLKLGYVLDKTFESGGGREMNAYRLQIE